MTETRQAIARESVRTSRDPLTRRLMVGLLFLILIFAGVVAYALWQMNANDKADDRRTEAAFVQLADDADAKQEAVQALADQLNALGEKPVVDPSSLPVTPSSSTVGPTGARGPGPSFSQVVAAVGTRIGMALEVNCGGSCEGDPGQDSTVAGPDGTDGQNGQNATDAQIAAAVASYCSSRNDCRGPGGTDGKDGPAAPRITASYCDPDDRFVIVLDDTTAITVADSDCRVDLLPDPEPTTTPEP